MKYGTVIKARLGYEKANEYYLWADELLKSIKKELKEKNIKLEKNIPVDIIYPIISKLYKNCTKKEYFKDICNIAKLYMEIEHCMSELAKGNNLTKEILKKTVSFQNAKIKYSKETKREISNPVDIIKAFLESLEAYHIKMKKTLCNEMKELKLSVLASSFSSVLKLDDDSLRYNHTKLPRSICIGQHIAGEDEFSQLLFSDKDNRPYVWLNLMHKGNLYIQDLDNDTRSMDRFISAYIFSCLDKFPLGALNIHIIDQNSNITNFIANKISSNLNKKIVTIHKDFSIIDNIKDVVCKDIAKKIGSSCRNIFELFEKDSSESINLIIIKAPLGDTSRYEIVNALEKIRLLTDEYGHNCGIRFLIIDTTKRKEPCSNDNLNQIIRNCGLVIKKEKGKYSIADLEFTPIYFEGDELAFIEMQSDKIVHLLSKKQKVSIPYDDIVRLKEYVQLEDAILRIPIGKTANKVVEMPFSCKGISGSVEEKCVSYMVIGATGSGKSSLFDSIVMCGSIKYSPTDLQFWLLDFKDGVATEKYKNSKIPHISVVADRNSPGDAISLLKMIKDEMKSRYDLFKQYSGCSDVYTFNQYQTKNRKPKMPRIIILIDEIQELMNCEYQYEIIQELLSVSNKIRAFGIHLVMVAQNLSDGRNNHLQDMLSQANGRICFRIDNEATLRNSSMGQEFNDRFQEIKNLGQGEIYLKYGNMEEPQKVQLAYVSPTMFENKYFPLIRRKYKTSSQTRVIGAINKLKIDGYSDYLRKSFYDAIIECQKPKKTLRVVLGENAYTHEMLEFELSEKENSSICFVGSNKEMSNSLMMSTLASLMGKRCNIHVFNGDASSGIKDFVSYVADENTFYRVRSEFVDVVTTIYSQFLERRKMEDEEVDVEYDPIILCINDATGIRVIRENIPMEGCSSENSYIDKTVAAVLNELATQGYRYKIFTVISITENVFEEQLISNVAKMVFFHNTTYIPSGINTMLFSDLMQSMKGDGEKSLALCVFNSELAKFRPFYCYVSKDRDILMKIAKGEKK